MLLVFKPLASPGRFHWPRLSTTLLERIPTRGHSDNKIMRNRVQSDECCKHVGTPCCVNASASKEKNATKSQTPMKALAVDKWSRPEKTWNATAELQHRQSVCALGAFEISQFLPLPPNAENNIALRTFVNSVCPPSIFQTAPKSTQMKISFSHFLCAARVGSVSDECENFCLIVILDVLRMSNTSDSLLVVTVPVRGSQFDSTQCKRHCSCNSLERLQSLTLKHPTNSLIGQTEMWQKHMGWHAISCFWIFSLRQQFVCTRLISKIGHLCSKDEKRAQDFSSGEQWSAKADHFHISVSRTPTQNSENGWFFDWTLHVVPMPISSSVVEVRHVQHHAWQTVTKSEWRSPLQCVASSTVSVTHVTTFIHHIMLSASTAPILSFHSICSTS